jgi:hypothetical protein
MLKHNPSMRRVFHFRDMDSTKKSPDWIAIEGEYRAGMKPVNSIASEYGSVPRACGGDHGWLSSIMLNILRET